jgi:hypothetical protein
MTLVEELFRFQPSEGGEDEGREGAGGLERRKTLQEFRWACVVAAGLW